MVDDEDEGVLVVSRAERREACALESLGGRGGGRLRGVSVSTSPSVGSWLGRRRIGVLPLSVLDDGCPPRGLGGVVDRGVARPTSYRAVGQGDRWVK